MTKCKKNIIITIVVLIALIVSAILGIYISALVKYGGNDMRMGRYKSFNTLEELQKDYKKAYDIKLPTYIPDEVDEQFYSYAVPGGFSAEDVVFYRKKLKRNTSISYKLQRYGKPYILSICTTKIDKSYKTLTILSDKIILDEISESSTDPTIIIHNYTIEKIYGLENAQYTITVVAYGSGNADKGFMNNEINNTVNSI